MFCPNCGKETSANTPFCSNCGAPLNVPASKPQHSVEQKHSVPKCTSCGYVGEWKMEPVLRPMDYVIGIAFMFMGIFPGIIYLGVVAANRSKSENRAKTCPQCGAKNLWTFLY